MKNMKKFLSLLLTALMIMSSASMIFAYAEGTTPACQEPVGELVDFMAGAYNKSTKSGYYTLTRDIGSLRVDATNTAYNPHLFGSNTDYQISNHKYEITYTLKMNTIDPLFFVTFLKTSGYTSIRPSDKATKTISGSSIHVGWGSQNSPAENYFKVMAAGCVTDDLKTCNYYPGNYDTSDNFGMELQSNDTYAKDYRVTIDGFNNTMTMYTFSGGNEYEVGTVNFTPDAANDYLIIGVFGNGCNESWAELSNVTIYKGCRDVDGGIDHECDECGDTLSEHADGNDKDHICDNGCEKTADDGCWETDKDHLCDECGEQVGTHADGDNDHLCDYGCKDPVISVCIDEDTDGKCDICKEDFAHECEDNDVNPKDHICDRCRASVGGDHVAADGKHTCDYCGERIGELVDFTEGAFSHYVNPDTCTWEITRAPGNLRVDGYSDQRNIVGSDTNYPIANHKYEINYTMKMDKVDSHTFVSFMKTNGYTVIYPDGDTKTFSTSNINTGWGYVSSDNQMASGYLQDNGSMLFWEGVYTGENEIFRLETQPDGILAKKFRLVIDGFNNEMTLYVMDGTTEHEVGTIQYISDPNNPNLRIGIYGNNFEAATRYEISNVTIYEYCSDAEPKNHVCDVCGEAVGDAHVKDHCCAYCGEIGTDCEDTDNDHMCNECGGVLSECGDTDDDNYCNHCGKYMPSGIEFDRITLEYGDETTTQPEDYYFTEKKLTSLPRTYEAWVNLPYDMRGGHQTILGSKAYSDGNGENAIWFYLTEGGVPNLIIYEDGASYKWTFSKSVVSRGAWVHLAIAFGYGDNGDEVACYINGELAEVSATKIALTSPDSFVNDRELRLGDDNYNMGSYSFKGILGNVAIYSDVRTDAEILADMQSVDVSDEGLIAYYRLDCATVGEDIPDASGNGYDMIHGKLFVTEEEMEDIKAKDENEYAYSIVFLPDTQYSVERYPDAFTSIYDYLIENKDSKNIKYVVSLGDMTNGGGDAQWDFVKQQTNRLNGIIPYTVLRGNHDDAAGMNAAFGDPDGYYYNYVKENGGFMDGNSVVNTYHLFSAGETDYIILVLDYHPSDDVLAWADTILEQYSDRLAIITTHSYVESNLSRGEEMNSTTSNSGEDMWNEMVKKHANVIMVVCGHIPDDNIIYRTDIGDNGNTVYQFLMDTQAIDSYACGVGVIAIMNFTADGEAVSIEYYSTYRDMYFKTHNYVTFSYDCYDGPDSDHLCDYCDESIGEECVDSDNNHKCDECDAELTHDTVSDDGDCMTAVVCSCGKVLVEAKGAHTFDNDCADTNCNVEGCNGIRDAAEHKYDDCEDTDCNNCDVTREALEHDWKETGNTATCGQAGVKTSKCECGATKTEASEATGAHTPDADDGDCTTDIVCSVCGAVTTEGADAHTGGTATCKELAKCTACGKEYGKLADHTPADIVIENNVAADCDTDGSYDEVVYCTVCDAELSRENKTVDALGHSDENADNACDVCGTVLKVEEEEEEKNEAPSSIVESIRNNVESVIEKATESATKAVENVVNSARETAARVRVAAEDAVKNVTETFESIRANVTEFFDGLKAKLEEVFSR